ncbi:MAG: DNA repair protein RadC [Lachnospiraceae bacterium]|nr:DNA repair protein RadC [Lachnospiraceae bacterium]
MNADIYKCTLVHDTSVEYKSIACSDDVADLLTGMGLDTLAEEVFYIICLNAKGTVAGIHEISHGDLCSSSAHPREVFKRAILNNAAAIILAHNHPSGNTKPSDADISTTERLVNAGDLLGINVVDHIIVAEGSYSSMKSQSLI